MHGVDILSIELGNEINIFRMILIPHAFRLISNNSAMSVWNAFRVERTLDVKSSDLTLGCDLCSPETPYITDNSVDVLSDERHREIVRV